MYIVADWFTGGLESLGIQNSLGSAIIRNKSIVRKAYIPTLQVFHAYCQDDPEMQQHYWTASFFLPIGAIFVLALVVLLMVLFKRCPLMVAAIVASIFGVIIIFAVLISLNHGPVYA